MVTKETDTVREEGVITIRDEQQKLVAIAYKDKGCEVTMYRVEKISYGDMKDFLAELSGQRQTIYRGSGGARQDNEEK